MAGSLAKGSLYLMSAQVAFLIAGYIIHAGLGRILGPATYGIFGVVLYLSMLTQDLVRNGVPQATSKFIAENPKRVGRITKTSLKLQLILSAGVFLFYFLSAGVIASLLGDTTLKPYIQLSAFLIPASAFFSLYVNILNGLRKYGEQGYCNILYAVGKVFFVFVLVGIGLGVYGALLGYMVAPLLGIFFARHFVKTPASESGRGINPKKLLNFSLPLIFYGITFTFLLSIDLFFIKRVLGNNVLVGYYTAASTLAKIPFYIFTAVGMALFPAISHSTSTRNAKLTRHYINSTFRYLIMTLLPVVILLSASSSTIVSIFYTHTYAPAAQPFSLLVIGMACFTLLSILNSIITASGKPWVSLTFLFSLVPISLFLLFLSVPSYKLLGAAFAMVFTYFFGFFIAALYVRLHFNALLPFYSLLRIAVGTVILLFITLNWHFTPVTLLPSYFVLLLLYLTILALLRELKEEDVILFKKLFRVV